MTQPVAACIPALQAAAAAQPLDAVLLPGPAHTHRHVIMQAWGFMRQYAALTASNTEMHVHSSIDSTLSWLSTSQKQLCDNDYACEKL